MTQERESVVYEAGSGIATMRLRRKHGNAINNDLLEALEASVRKAREDGSVKGALLAADGKLFCPGLDLQELISYDRPAMEDFMQRFRRCLLDLYSFPKPMVAAISSHALAGGCVLSLAADWRLLRKDAIMGLNEVRVGVPLPKDVAIILRDSVPRSRLEEVALLGRNYSNDQAVAAGLAHEIHGERGFEAHARSRLDEFVEKEPRAFAATKRYLRQATLDRIRSEGDGHIQEFLEIWFSPETRRRIGEIVEKLRGARSRDDATR